VKTGALKRRHGEHSYWLVVPASYDPARTYQVRFQLHGGVMREDPSLRGDGVASRGVKGAASSMACALVRRST
jgi:hypothetical protein